MDDDLITRAEELYAEAADGQPLGAERLERLCAAHPRLAPILQQVHRVSHHLAVPLRPPEIPGYTLSYLIGEGGMGRVWAARHEALDRMVAIKVLAPGLADDTRGRVRMLREARAMARVRHQHVVPIYDVIDRGELLAIAMELVPGDDLSSAVDRWRHADEAPRPRERVRFVIEVANQVAQALSAAHAAGVLHRDVKPSNIRIRHGDGQAMLVDFGVARSRDEHTMTEGFVGTARFAAPEQIRGEDVDERTDLFALGRTIEWALEASASIVDPTETRPDTEIDTAPSDSRVPPDLRAVVAKALEPDRRDRYASASAMAQDLAAVLDGRPVSARPRPLPLRAYHWVVRDRLRLGLVAALAVASLLGVALYTQWPRLEAQWRLEREAAYERRLQRAFHLAIDPATRPRAADAFAAVQELVPDSPEAALGRAGALLLSGDRDGARASLRDQPELFELMQPLIDGGARRNTDASANGGSNGDEGDGAGHAPPDPTADAIVAYFEALRLPSDGRFDRAVEQLQDLVASTETARELYHGMLAYAASGAERTDVLLRIDAAMQRLWPDSASAHCWRTLAWQDRDAGRALAALRRTFELDPSYEESFLGLAIELRLAAGDPEGAAAEVDRRLRIERDGAQRARLLMARSSVEAARGEIDAAIRSLEEACTLEPDVARTHARLSSHLWELDSARAIEHTRRWAELAPNDANAWRVLGMRHIKQKQYEAAVEALEIGVRLAPEDGVMCSLLGEALFFVRDQRAEATLRRAGSLEPESARAHYYISQIRHRAGDREGAVTALEEALARLEAGGYGVRRSSVERALGALRR